MVTFSIFISRTAPLSHGYNRSGYQIRLLFINPWAEAENKKRSVIGLLCYWHMLII